MDRAFRSCVAERIYNRGARPDPHDHIASTMQLAAAPLPRGEIPAVESSAWPAFLTACVREAFARARRAGGAEARARRRRRRRAVRRGALRERRAPAPCAVAHACVAACGAVRRVRAWPVRGAHAPRAGVHRVARARDVPRVARRARRRVAERVPPAAAHGEPRLCRARVLHPAPAARRALLRGARGAGGGGRAVAAGRAAGAGARGGRAACVPGAEPAGGACADARVRACILCECRGGRRVRRRGDRVDVRGCADAG